jgi:hypothetical protein
MKTFIVLVIIIGCYLGMAYDDQMQVRRIEAHKQETIAAAKAEAHKKAVAMREAGLFERSNALMFPCCQAHVSIAKE